jgi:hypothetical protein
MAAKAVEEGAAEESLSRAHFPGYGDKSLPLLNPIQQMPERLLMGRTEKQESWVGCNAKGFFLEAEKGQYID